MNYCEFLSGLNPLRNPAVRSTLTWNPKELIEAYKGLNKAKLLKHGWRQRRVEFSFPNMKFVIQAPVEKHLVFYLVRHHDGQYFLLTLRNSDRGDYCSDDTFFTDSLDGNLSCCLSICNYESVGRFTKEVSTGIHSVPSQGTARLGIGSRMTVHSWPAVFDVVERRHMDSNLIQNSVREARVLRELEKGETARNVNLFGFGTISEGHTGNTLEGLWLTGTVYAMFHRLDRPYGSDLDHVKISDRKKSLTRAKNIISACRNYSFYTIDTSELVNFSGNDNRDSYVQGAGDKIESLVRYHREESYSGIRPTKEFVTRMLNKYRESLLVLEEIDDQLSSIHGKNGYDLEWSIDEIPHGLDISKHITDLPEIAFIIREIRRRNIGLTHLAPNWGVEKGQDYRMPGGLKGLRKRMDPIFRYCSDVGVILDVHSGDDLSRSTRRVISETTDGGKINFKISPRTLEIFARVVYAKSPDTFAFWWDAANNWALSMAAKGSAFAARCVEEAKSTQSPSPESPVFRYYHYPPIGIISDSGQLELRERLYTLPAHVVEEYKRSLKQYLEDLVTDLYTDHGGRT